MKITKCIQGLIFGKFMFQEKGIFENEVKVFEVESPLVRLNIFNQIKSTIQRSSDKDGWLDIKVFAALI
jgi:hypothetical protein